MMFAIKSFFISIIYVATLCLTPFFAHAGPTEEARIDISSLTTADGTRPSNLEPHPIVPNLYVQKTVTQKIGADGFPSMTELIVSEIYYTLVETENGRHLVEFKPLSFQEVNLALRQDANFARNFGGAVRGFPAEYGKFNAAMIVMEVVSCYGIGNGSLFNQWKWQPTTNSNTPLCADHLLKAMTTLEGNIGFFSFVLGNRIASAHLNNLAVATSAAIGKPLTEQSMRKLRPLMGYMGMSFGMAAQQIVSHILTIPTFKECARDMSQGNFTSTFCREAVTHFLSAEKFWLDFGAGIPSLIGGAMMSAGTRKFAEWAVTHGKFFNVPAEARASKTALLRYMRRAVGWKVAKTVFRVGRVGASAAGGVFVMVGEMVIFLAWTKVLEIPSMQMVWYLYDAPDIRRNTRQLFATTTAIETARGFAPETVDVSCTTSRNRGGTKTTCNSIDYLAQSLKDLDFYSKRYRERVTLARLTRSFPDYMMKWEKYIASFFAGKFVLQEIYAQRQQRPITLLSLYDTAFAVKSIWQDYFLYGSNAGRVESYKIFLQQDITNIETAFTAYKDSFKTAVTDRTQLEQRLATLLVAFKQKVSRQAPWNAQRQCGGFYEDADFCRAMKMLRFIPQNKDLFFSQNRESFASYNVEWVKLLSETLPVENTLRQVLCADKTTFQSSASMNGLPSTLKFPRFVNLAIDSSYAESCLFAKDNPLFLAKDMDESADFSDVKPGAIWLTNFSKYIDPLSVLTDTRVRLTPGATLEDALRWWNTLMVTEVLTFYKKYITSYKQMLDDNFFSYISYENAANLVAYTTIPRNLRGAVNTPVNESNLHQKVLNRESVNLSLIGQMQIYAKALEKVSGAFYPGPNQRRISLKQKLDGFVLLFAEHTRNMRYANDAASIDAIPIDNIGGANPFLFTQDVARTLFADTFKQKGQRMEELYNISGELSEELIGLNFNDIDNIDTETTFSAAQVSQMSPADYKKYTVLQIVKHIRLLLEETNNYYDSYIFLTGLFNLTKE